uniref:Uncharacterized protein n=1 Tax=Arundo donax TaxID=35708 RepID=A0A0A8ZUN1_ARUDO
MLQSRLSVEIFSEARVGLYETHYSISKCLSHANILMKNVSSLVSRY